MVKKAVRKSLLKNKKLLFGITTLFILAIFIFSLAQFTYDYLKINNNAYIDATNQEDFRLYTDPAFLPVLTNEYITQIEEDLNVQMEQRSVTTISNENEVHTQITSFDENAEINKLVVADGDLPYNEGEIFILEKYATDNDIQVGDTLTINGSDYIVSGFGYIPEYTMPFDMIQGSLPGTPFLPCYMNDVSYEKMAKDNEVIYYPVTTNDKLTADEEKVLREKMVTDYTVQVPLTDEFGNPTVSATGEVEMQDIGVFYVALDDESNPPLTAFTTEIDADRAAFNIFCFVIIGFTIFLTIVLYNSIFKNQRREMGILKAEGLTNRELKFHFTKYLVYILSFAAFIGILFGYLIAPTFAYIYMTLYTIPFTVHITTTILVVIAAVMLIIIFVVILVYYFSIRRNIKIPPLILIKNIEHSRKPRFKFSGRLSRLPFKIKYRISILLRNFSYILVLSIGVFIASFLLLMGALLMGTMTTMMSDTYSKMFTYDYAVTYTQEYIAEETDNSTLTYRMELSDVSTDATIDDGTSIKVVGFDAKNAEHVHLSDIKGNAISASDYENGVVISDLYAKKYDLAIGDTLTFKNPINPDENITVVVNNIANDGFYASIYLDLDYFQDILNIDDTYTNGAYILADEKQAIQDLDPDAQFVSSVDLETSMNNTMRVFYLMVGVIMVIASIIAFISLTLITVVVVSNNRKTISIMKVLGYSNSEIRKMTTSTYKYIILVVYIVSMPIIEKIVQTIIDYAMRNMDFSLNVNLTLSYAIIGLIVVFIIYFLAMVVAQHSINKIPLAESLKIDE